MERGGELCAPAGLKSATQNKLFRIIDSYALVAKHNCFYKQLYQGF